MGTDLNHTLNPTSKKKRPHPLIRQPTKEKDGKSKTNTIAVVRALRAMGLLRIAVRELALPSTSTWKKGQDSIFMALQRWNGKNTIKRRKTGSGFCRNCLLGYESHRFLRCWVEQRDIWNEGKNHGWEENACVLRPSKIASFSSLAEIEDRERLESTLLLLRPSKPVKTSCSAWVLCCNTGVAFVESLFLNLEMKMQGSEVIWTVEMVDHVVWSHWDGSYFLPSE